MTKAKRDKRREINQFQYRNLLFCAYDFSFNTVTIMGENWVGKAVSIKCIDDVGIFQGIIKDADSSKIIISKAFRNGLPIKTLDAEVTIM